MIKEQKTHNQMKLHNNQENETITRTTKVGDYN